MSIVSGAIVPHPPTLVAGGDETDRTSELEAIRKGLKIIGQKIFACNPQTLVFVSPHGSCFADAFAVKKGPILRGHLVDRGLSIEASCDLDLVNQLLEESQGLGVPALGLEKDDPRAEFSTDLDHGILVPLVFLKQEYDIPIISISVSDLGTFEHYRLGVAIRKASESLGRNVAVIASGCLSHSQIEDSVELQAAKVIDQQTIEGMKKGDFRQVIGMDSAQIEDVGGCGLMPLMVLAGTFDGYEISTDIIAYDSPHGDGYLVALISPQEKSEKRRLLDEIPYLQKVEVERRRKRESQPVSIAREAVEMYVKGGKTIKPPKNLPKYLTKTAAVFVSLKKGGALRGCIGTTAATTASTAEEIIQNAIHSATRDPRFFPVEVSELPHLVYSVDILGELEEVQGESQLDHKKYGVYVLCGGRCGLLLPDIDGVNSVEKQVYIAKQKGGITDDEAVQLFRFKVARYK